MMKNKKTECIKKNTVKPVISQISGITRHKKYGQENIDRFHFSVRNILTEFFLAARCSYFSPDRVDRFDL
jgi:hypothetical protein